MSQPATPTIIGRGTRLTGEERASFTKEVVHMYVEEGRSIRAIGAATNRSYGAIHRLLQEANVNFRPRGNPAA